MTKEEAIDYGRKLRSLEKRAEKARELIDDACETIKNTREEPNGQDLEEILENYGDIMAMLSQYSQACDYCRSYGFRTRIRSHAHQKCCKQHRDLCETRRVLEKQFQKIQSESVESEEENEIKVEK